MSINEVIADYGFIGIFLVSFLTGIGLPPVPEEIPIIAAGIVSSKAGVRWWLAWPACMVGVVTADMVLYSAGRFWGQRLFRVRWIKKILPPERRQNIEDGFHRHGVKILLTGRLLPGLRTGVFLTAGAMRYPFLRFLIADAIYAIPGVAIIFFGSYFLTQSFQMLIHEVHKVQWWILVALLTAAGAYSLYWLYSFQRERALSNDFDPPTMSELVHPPGHHHGHGSKHPSGTASANSPVESPKADPEASADG